MKTSKKGRHPELSLIYVNFRSVRILRESLRSLCGITGFPKNIEIIVANNDFSESWALRALSREFPVRIIETGENRGFGSAANTAVRFASAPFLGFINPDTRLISGNPEIIPEIFRKYQKIGILGGRLIGNDGLPEPWSAGVGTSLLEIIKNNLGAPSGKRIWESSRPKRAGYVSGAAFFIRSSLFRELSGFDRRFFLYFEDVDLCTRAKAFGWQVWTFPGVVFSHEGGASHDSKRMQKNQFFDSQDRYFIKHRPHWEAMTLKRLRLMFTRHP